MSCISCVFCRNNSVKNTDTNLVDMRKDTFFLQGAAVHRLGFPSKSKHERLFVVFFMNRKIRLQFAQGRGAEAT